MATWNGNAMLVQHKCGCQVWCESHIIGDSLTFEFRAFGIIGSEWWMGDILTTCPRCGAEYLPFMNKQWTEA